jgi:glycosyltransferase involved in cell wall biosynthesis
MQRTLVVVSNFPASGGSRIDKFVKFLPSAGIEPVILSAQEKYSPAAAELEKQLYPAALRHYLARSVAWSYFAERFLDRGRDAKHYRLLQWLSFPERCVLVPDHMVRWIPAGIAVGRQLVADGISTVLTSSPPESTHLIGMALKKRCGVRWVADFRDLWTDKQLTYRPATTLHDRWIRRIERRVFALADHIIANTPENAERYRQRFHLTPERLSIIPNGYDPEDLPAAASAPQDSGKQRDVFEIGYMGNFDKHDFPWRLFLQSLARLAGDVGDARVKLVHCGFISRQVFDYLREHRMESVIHSHGMLPHTQAMHIISRTSLRLLLLYENPYSGAIVPAKLYNYLLMPGPVLAIAPEQGATASILARTRMGRTISPSRGVESAYRLLRQFFDRWSEGRLVVQPDALEVAKYDRRRHAVALAKILAAE